MITMTAINATSTRPGRESLLLGGATIACLSIACAERPLVLLGAACFGYIIIFDPSPVVVDLSGLSGLVILGVFGGVGHGLAGFLVGLLTRAHHVHDGALHVTHLDAGSHLQHHVV